MTIQSAIFATHVDLVAFVNAGGVSAIVAICPAGQGTGDWVLFYVPVSS